MTRILLIADSERLQRIFRSLAERGGMQLQTASTLALGEFELASFSPDFTFVQSRISGFSGEILLRHLDKMLGGHGELVLVAGDGEEAAHARRHGRSALDPTVEDALLERSVKALLTGAPPPSPPLQEKPQTAAPKAARTKGAPPPAEAAGEQAPPERGEQEKSAQRADEAVQPAPPLPSFEPMPLEPPPFEPPSAPPAVVEPYPPSGRVAGSAAASAFEDVMRQAEAKVPPLDASVLEVEDRVEVGKGAERRPAALEVLETPAAPDGVKGAGGYFAGETVAEALLRIERKKRRNPYLFIVPALVLIGVPLASYLAGKNSAPPQAEQVAPAPVRPAPRTPTREAAPPAAPAAPLKTAPPAAAPATKTPPAPAATPAPAHPPAQAKAPERLAKRGLEQLPPLLEGTRLDTEYAKKHRGWVRYQGVRAEYKLFREGGVYRALQVIPVAGGTIADDLFKRILREFGGVDSYRVESAARKGGYLVEQCAASGDVALTIYRGKANTIKALVVYYR